MEGDDETPQMRPVGRPPKHGPAKKVDVRLGKLFAGHLLFSALSSPPVQLGPSNAPGDAQSPPSSSPRRKLPGWLQSQFDEKLRLAGIRENGLPLLYARDKTFWFPLDDPYFTPQHLESLSPQKMFRAQFFLWNPDVLVSPARIPCPICRTGLIRLCPIPRPRRRLL
ncbi:hypothetical protein B0H14DRAFT_3746196 [Mycena olivaceomarginata]|nr:hypothetical protein B0H14DRAFT_3746196 [Mycena olivaceomarginata]